MARSSINHTTQFLLHAHIHAQYILHTSGVVHLCNQHTTHSHTESICTRKVSNLSLTNKTTNKQTHIQTHTHTHTNTTHHINISKLSFPLFLLLFVQFFPSSSLPSSIFPPTFPLFFFAQTKSTLNCIHRMASKLN